MHGRGVDQDDPRASDLLGGRGRSGSRGARRRDTYVVVGGSRKPVAGPAEGGHYTEAESLRPKAESPSVMSTPVVMPQMGESIAEGTIVRWIKKVGDSVDRDEPLFEISTDKVDAEIPAPVAGVLTEIKVQAGETVAVNEVVA